MSALLEIKVRTDSGNAAAELDRVGTSASKMSRGMQQATPYATGVVAALATVAGAAGRSASELQQSTGAVQSVFGAHAAAVQGYANSAASNVGLATSEYQTMASVVGSQLKNMGVPTEALAGQTNDLITMGADLAATFGGSTSEAVEALGALMRGEADPIERYGVSIKQADIAAQKSKMGLDGLTGAADKQATTQAMLALLTQQTTGAQGAFAREAGTAAGALERGKAAAQNAGAQLGTVLLPAMAALGMTMASAAGFVARHSTAFTILAAVLGIVAGAVLAYNAIMAVVPVATAIATAAQWAWNASLLANPITWIVLGIIALIAIVVLLVRHWDQVKAASTAAWNAVKSGASAVGTALAGVGSAIAGAFRAAFSAIASAARAAWAGISAAARATGAALAAVGSAIASAFRAAFAALAAAGRAAWAALQAAGRAFGAAASAVASGISASFAAAFAALQAAGAAAWAAVQAGAQALSGIASSVAAAVQSAFLGAFNAVRSVGGSFLDGAISAIQSVLGLAGRAADAIAGIASKAAGLASKISGLKLHQADVAHTWTVQPRATAQFASADPLTASWATAGGGSQPTIIRQEITMNVDFNGIATDPIGIAAEIERVLDNRRRLIGVVA